MVTPQLWHVLPLMEHLKLWGTKLEIDPNNWDLKYGRVEGKSATALSINKKLDNIRGRIDKIYEDMLKHEGFATAQKVKLSFLGVGVMMMQY